MPEPESVTAWDLIQLARANFDAVMAVWGELGQGHTLADATIEWARRAGRELVVVDSKGGGAR